MFLFRISSAFILLLGSLWVCVHVRVGGLVPFVGIELELAL